MKGFTLIETIVTVAVFGIILGGLSSSILLSYRTQGYTFEQSQALQEARRALEQMVQEIREATTGEDGSYIIGKAEDYELIFFSDIDKDGEVERVRYMINPKGGNTGSETKYCTSFVSGGTCQVTFSNFLIGTLQSATLETAVEGDLNKRSETALITANGVALGTLCVSGCGQCLGSYQGLTSFDITTQAGGDSVTAIADGSDKVGTICPLEDPNYSLKAQFTLRWVEDTEVQNTSILRKGIIQPTEYPVSYPEDQEVVTIISQNALNDIRFQPMFTYYDDNNNVLTSGGDRITKTSRIHIEVIVNVNPSREPGDFSLESDVHIRNLKTNL